MQQYKYTQHSMPLQRLHLRPPGGFFHACGMDACNKVHPAVKTLFQRRSFGKRAQLVQQNNLRRKRAQCPASSRAI